MRGDRWHDAVSVWSMGRFRGGLRQHLWMDATIGHLLYKTPVQRQCTEAYWRSCEQTGIPATINHSSNQQCKKCSDRAELCGLCLVIFFAYSQAPRDSICAYVSKCRALAGLCKFQCSKRRCSLDEYVLGKEVVRGLSELSMKVEVLRCLPRLKSVWMA